MSESNFAELDRLIESLYTENLSDPDDARLEQLVASDLVLRRRYLEQLFLTSQLQWRFRKTSPPRKASRLLTFLGRSQFVSRGEFTVGALLIFAVTAGFCGLAMYVGRVSHRLPAVNDFAVATVRDVGDVKWSADTVSKRLDAAVRQGEPLKIESGKMELELKAGTKLVIEGPADWSVDGRNNVSLRAGKLLANVPQQAIGFTIETPTAKVVDLGTEFGVEVNESGATDVHVIRGTIEVDRSGSSNTAGTPSSKKRLVAGQAIRVDRAGVGKVAVTSKTGSTSRGTVTDVFAVDLVDIIAGGDGSGGHRDRGIDPASGRIVLMPRDDYSLFTKALRSEGYTHIDDWRFIDGVGIPDSGKGPVQLDSAKHMFDGFPKTSGNSCGPLWAGGQFPQPPNFPQIRCTFDDITDYGIAPHCLLTLIPNKLITFDLAAIRRANPGRTLSVFRSMIGMTKPEGFPPEVGLGDTWVFVDGEMRHCRRAINAANGPEDVAVSLPASARFLTLAATDGGNEFHCDWILFADPRIELAIEDQPTDSEAPASQK